MQQSLAVSITVARSDPQTAVSRTGHGICLPGRRALALEWRYARLYKSLCAIALEAEDRDRVEVSCTCLPSAAAPVRCCVTLRIDYRPCGGQFPTAPARCRILRGDCDNADDGAIAPWSHKGCLFAQHEQEQ